jgi:hypothetical protein
LKAVTLKNGLGNAALAGCKASLETGADLEASGRFGKQYDREVESACFSCH